MSQRPQIQRRRFAHLASLLAVLLAPWWAVAQPIPEIIGIGLSGSQSARDTVVIDTDSLDIMVSYTPNAEWTVDELGFNLNTRNQVLLYGYSAPGCGGTGYPPQTMFLDRATYILMPDSVPQRLRVRMAMERLIDGRIRSFQLALGVLSSNGQGEDTISVLRSSADTVGGGVFPTLDSVDVNHALCVTFHDIRTVAPELLEPHDGAILGRRFVVTYIQPEWAATRSTVLVIESRDPNVREQHVLTLEDWSSGNNKQVSLDALALGDSPDVYSVVGGDSLQSNIQYRFLIAYTDVNGNPDAVDSSTSVIVDMATQPPNLIEPQYGSVNTDSTLLVIYQLPELADSVWLSFVTDSLSVYVDTLEHHLLLTPEFNGTGLTTLTLDPRFIGTGGRYVAYNPNGFEDRLMEQVAYDVTLSYGDLPGNADASDSHWGVVWPYDSVTIAPVLEAPAFSVRFNQTVWVQFYFPETPLPGSVRLLVAAIGLTDPGSPRTIHFGTLGTGGRIGFFLNAADLLSSDLVTSVEGGGTPEQNNQLYDGTRYALRLAYQDSEGNLPALSVPRIAVYDNSTDPVIINSPSDGDTIPYVGLTVNWDQSEIASPATLRLTLTQMGGPDFDTGSPHTLFLSEIAAGNGKTVTIAPFQLDSGSGVDSMQGGPTLIRRGIYMMSLEYRDSLANPPQRMSVENLILLSGSSVTVHGGSLGSEQVVAGEVNRAIFHLTLSAPEGQSAVRSIRFSVDGDVDPADIHVGNTRLWSSRDSVFSATADTAVAILGSWFGGAFVFDDFAIALSTEETYLFAAVSFAASANGYHRLRLYIASPDDIDCGGDPVSSAHWPIGERDVPLPVSFVSFATEQDTSFGALRVYWRVASELNNLGFNLHRRAGPDTEYVVAGSYANEPRLVGRGTSVSPWQYTFIDHGLTPGVTYHYRVDAVAVGGEVHSYDVEAAGTPRLPPSHFALADAFPNPFNHDVTIKYVVPYTGTVELIIYDLTGREVRTLVRALQPAAEYTANWDSRDNGGHLVPSGIYFYRLRAASIFDQTRKLLLIR